jgi:DNA-binding MarR family transcriptional regulator
MATAMNKGGASSDPLETHLGYWMRLVSNHVSGAFARTLSDHDISTAEWVALNRIERLQGLTSSALSVSMGMTRGAVSKILDKLESKSLIMRSASPDDSRVQFLSLTRDARRLLPVLTKVANNNDAQFFSALDEEEQTALRKILQKLSEIHKIHSVPVE